MSNAIQEQLNIVSANGICKIDTGEYEGPFVIRKPCTIKGTATTLWASSGPILKIEADNVYIKNLRFELTGSAADRVAIDTQNHRVFFDQVEIDGNVIGLEGESDWIMPKTLNLGEFSSDSESTFWFEIFATSKAKLVSNIEGIEVNVSELNKGLNKIKITTKEFRNNTCIYGELLIKSAFIRRIYISGKVSSEYGIQSDKMLFEVNGANYDNVTDILSSPIITNNQNQGSESIISSHNDTISENLVVVRGQRVPIFVSEKIAIEYSFETNNISVDPYIFLLKQNEKVINDESLIFFGNNKSLDNAVELQDGKAIIDINNLHNEISIVRVVFSIYNEGNKKPATFNDVRKISISVLNNKKCYVFDLSDIKNGESILALDVYKEDWKIKFIGQNFSKDIASFCNDFGVNVD